MIDGVGRYVGHGRCLPVSSSVETCCSRRAQNDQAAQFL
jgi:hypothetical protein